MSKLADLTCVEFTKQLQSKEPVPGGGGVAALVGALGIALCSMAANYTTGKKKYAQYEDDIRRILKRGDEIQSRLLELIDEDAKMFEPLSQAYSIPKDDPTREETLEKVSIQACQAALEMMRQIAEAIELLEEMLIKGSVLMVSDVGCGALCARCAMEAASYNIFVNTKSFDLDKVGAIEDEANQLLEEYCKRAEDVSSAVADRLRR